MQWWLVALCRAARWEQGVQEFLAELAAGRQPKDPQAPQTGDHGLDVPVVCHAPRKIQLHQPCAPTTPYEGARSRVRQPSHRPWSAACPSDQALTRCCSR